MLHASNSRNVAKVEVRSTFLATRNATIAVTKWGVTREFFLATCNTTFVALQLVTRKIASCNMAFTGFNFTRHSVCNSPCSIYQILAPRLSRQTSIFGVVFFVSKFLLGIERQTKILKNYSFRRESLEAMLEY